jgi:hypothetical protein
MLDTLERPQKYIPPRWLSVSGSVLRAFALGLATGKFLVGAKPSVDGTMTVVT